MPNEAPRPGDPKLFIFSYAVSICRALIPPRLRRSAGTVLFGVAPGVPITLASTLAQSRPRKAFIYGVALGLFFCLGVITVWSLAVGTFQGADPTRLYFRNDYTNICNYAFIGPLYIGFGATLIVLACQSWVSIQSDPLLAISGGFRTPKLPLGVVFFIIIFLSAGLTCNFIVECLNPAIYPKVGWYIASVDGEGNRIIRGLGIYYAVMTYSLFLICLSATYSLFFLFITAAEVTQFLRREKNIAPESFEALRASLSNFVSGYIVAKLFAAILMLNTFTWWWSQQQRSFNMWAMGAALTVGGIFLISIPRYYVELTWYEVNARRAIESGENPPEESRDLRPKNVRLLAWILDGLIFSTYIFSFWLNK